MKKIITIGILLVISSKVFSQVQVTIAAGIDTVTNTNIKKIVLLWDNYLNSNPDSIYDNPFWCQAEKIKYKSFDLINTSGFLSPSLYGLTKNWKNIILTITPIGEDYLIRSLFYTGYKNGKIYTLAIINTIAKKENGNFKLCNYLNYATRSWNNYKTELINYFYYPSYPFNKRKAQEANIYYKTICSVLDVPPKPITYYIAENCNTVRNIQGFDFVVGMGGEYRACGFFDFQNYIIYSSSENGVLHKHEILHHLLTKYNKSGIFHLGLVGYWGENNGMPFDEQVKIVNKYLMNHKEIDLSDFINFNYIDEYINPQYTIPGIFCHLALKQGGIEKLKELLNSGSDYKTTIKNLFGVKEKDLNKFIREKLNEYSKCITIITPNDFIDK